MVKHMKRSWRLSWQCITHSVAFFRNNLDLLVFSVLKLLAAAFALAVLFSFFGLAAWLYGESALRFYGSIAVGSLGFVFGLILLAFVTMFFQAALISVCLNRLRQQPLSLAEGFSNAWRNRSALLFWAIINCVVQNILHAFQRQQQLVTNLILAGAEVSWALGSFFVVPLIVDRHCSAKEALKESLHTFKRGWFMTLSVGGIIGLITLLPVGLWALLYHDFPQQMSEFIWVAGSVLGLWILLVATVGASINGIVKSVLYLYLFEQQKTNVLPDAVLTGFIAKPERATA